MAGAGALTRWGEGFTRCRMTRRSLVVVVLLVVAAASGAALAYRSWAARAAGDGAAEKNDRAATVSAPKVTAPAAPPTTPVTAKATPSARETVELTVYFPSRRYVESGDESLPR